MTNAPITGKASIVLNMEKNVNNVQKGSGSDSFAQVMDKNKTVSQQDVSETKYENAVHSGTQVKNSGKKVLKEQKTQELETEQDSLAELPQEAVDEAAQKIVEEIAKQMGIPVEEVMTALQTLDLTPMDLLSKDNLANLLITLNPGSDMMSMLTDETMYDALTQLTKTVETTVEELKETFSLTDEEFTAVLAESKKAAGLEDGKSNEKEKQIQQLDSVKLPEDDKAPITKEEVFVEKGKVEAAVTDKAVVVETVAKNSASEDPQAAKVEVTVDKVDSQGEKTQKEFTGQDTADEKNAKEDGNSNQQSQQPLFQTVANRFNQVQEMPAEAQNLRQTADTESIMRQIMDYMKIQVKADLTQMEIQLHPSSLGNINVQISSREGLITAQFTAQNEGVKAALESQIVQLKENLNEQGLKVEAVEVTVASHQFESQMEQGQQDGSQEADSKKKGIRRINLDELGDLEEEMLEEADKITADMMEKNGNTVDYMV